MKPVEAAEIVGMIVIAYPVPSWEFETQKLWQRMIGDLDGKIATAVVEDWIRTKDDRPTIAAIRRGVADRQFVKADGTKLFLPPDEAWEYVDGCFGSVGRGRPFPATHPLVAEAVSRIGWVSMCNSENKDVLRGQFRMAYTPLLERSLAESAASEGAASAPSAVGLEHQPQKIAGPEPLRIARVRS